MVLIGAVRKHAMSPGTVQVFSSVHFALRNAQRRFAFCATSPTLHSVWNNNNNNNSFTHSNTHSSSSSSSTHTVPAVSWGKEKVEKTPSSVHHHHHHPISDSDPISSGSIPQVKWGASSSSQPPLSSSSTTLNGVHTSKGAAMDTERDLASSPILSYPYEVVDTEEALHEAVKHLSQEKTIALDVEAFCCTTHTGSSENGSHEPTPTPAHSKQLGKVSLVQACSNTQQVVYIFDVLTLGSAAFVSAIEGVMVNTAIRKLFFDCRRDVEALSCQMGLRPTGVLDLQLLFTATQWKAKSANRRSGMSYVLKSVTGMTRQEGDSAVQVAMTLGNRAVWDVRPLPPHFLEYAAGDVRHIQLLASVLLDSPSINVDAVERLTAQYVAHYGVGKPVEVEADAKPAEVNVDWLQRFLGPGGVCAFCGSIGHTQAECFKKHSGKTKCNFCGEMGHMARHCYKKFPQLLKCSSCGQMGHTAASCFKTNPCKYCGGAHSSDNCHSHARTTADAPPSTSS